jgi:hypothetical protein
LFKKSANQVVDNNCLGRSSIILQEVQLTKPSSKTFTNEKTTGLEGGITAGYDRAKNLLCTNGDCTTGPTCSAGQCSSSERLQTLKDKLMVSGFASAGDCPTATIDLTMMGLGSHELDAHCLLLEQARPTIQIIADFIAAISFVFIILGA